MLEHAIPHPVDFLSTLSDDPGTTCERIDSVSERRLAEGKDEACHGFTRGLDVWRGVCRLVGIGRDCHVGAMALAQTQLGPEISTT
jgi:hypothetical protein